MVILREALIGGNRVTRLILVVGAISSTDYRYSLLFLKWVARVKAKGRLEPTPGLDYFIDTLPRTKDAT